MPNTTEQDEDIVAKLDELVANCPDEIERIQSLTDKIQSKKEYIESLPYSQYNAERIASLIEAERQLNARLREITDLSAQARF